jgi:hypothetical protein
MIAVLRILLLVVGVAIGGASGFVVGGGLMTWGMSGATGETFMFFQGGVPGAFVGAAVGGFLGLRLGKRFWALSRPREIYDRHGASGASTRSRTGLVSHFLLASAFALLTCSCAVAATYRLMDVGGEYGGYWLTAIATAAMLGFGILVKDIGYRLLLMFITVIAVALTYFFYWAMAWS